MSLFWRPTFDPFRELLNHAETLDHHSDLFDDVALVVNKNAKQLEKLTKQNAALLREVGRLGIELEKLKNNG